MGIHDRDYYRDEGGSSTIAGAVRTAVGALIAGTVIVWLLQVATESSRGPGLTGFLEASPGKLAGLHIYTVVTAVFAHSTRTIWHLAWNMLFLYFFGRELEQIYGRRDFLVFYLVAGGLSILAEVILLWVSGHETAVLGASGAIMGLVVLYTIFYPNRQILFLFFLPMPVWVLCAIFIIQDLLGVLGGSGNGVANLAHLTGAGVGFAYWYLDPRSRRWGNIFSRWRLGRRVGLLRGWRHRRGERQPTARILRMPSRGEDPSRQVSRRIDELLAKISAEGKESLTEEEWSFLRENSSQYRS